MILFSRPELVVAQGKMCLGEELSFIDVPQQGYKRRPCSGIVVRSNSVPQGQAVAWTEIPRQAAATNKMLPELERIIDQVLVPILVKRYVSKLKDMNLNCGIAK